MQDSTNENQEKIQGYLGLSMEAKNQTYQLKKPNWTDQWIDPHHTLKQ